MLLSGMTFPPTTVISIRSRIGYNITLVITKQHSGIPAKLAHYERAKILSIFCIIIIAVGLFRLQ